MDDERREGSKQARKKGMCMGVQVVGWQSMTSELVNLELTNLQKTRHPNLPVPPHAHKHTAYKNNIHEHSRTFAQSRRRVVSTLTRSFLQLPFSQLPFTLLTGVDNSTD